MRGYIAREYSVWCGGAGVDGCTYWARLTASEARSVREAGRIWKLQGWRLTRKQGWLCKYCAKNLTKEKNE